ncbi:DUF4013 domain-containing protein, partial [Halorubrum sp. SS5]
GPVEPAATATAVESALGPNGPAAVAVVAAGTVLALVGAYLAAFAYVRPAALAAFAASGRLRDGLDPRTVAGVAATGPYATGWTLAVGALAVGYAVAAPTVPLVVGVAVAFLARIVAHDLYGRGAADSLTEETAATAPTATRRLVGTAHDAARSNDEAGADAGSSPSVGAAGDGPPAPVVSGDGGRPMRSEPPAAVQVGRGVSVGEGSDAVGSDATDESADADPSRPGDASDGDADPTGGFEWGPALSEAEDKS